MGLITCHKGEKVLFDLHYNPRLEYEQVVIEAFKNKEVRSLSEGATVLLRHCVDVLGVTVKQVARRKSTVMLSVTVLKTFDYDPGRR